MEPCVNSTSCRLCLVCHRVLPLEFISLDFLVKSFIKPCPSLHKEVSLSSNYAYHRIHQGAVRPCCPSHVRVLAEQSDYSACPDHPGYWKTSHWQYCRVRFLCQGIGTLVLSSCILFADQNSQRDLYSAFETAKQFELHVFLTNTDVFLIQECIVQATESSGLTNDWGDAIRMVFCMMTDEQRAWFRFEQLYPEAIEAVVFGEGEDDPIVVVEEEALAYTGP